MKKMISLLMALIFVSDVQLNTLSSYPDSIATIIAAEIGNGVVYDAGDLVENGGFLEEQEYLRYKQLFPYSIPVPGNHDHYDGLDHWTWNNTVDTYDEGVHIVGFDTNERFDQSKLDWLSQTLNDGSFTILYLHHQLFSDNERNGAIAPHMRNIFLPIVEANDVDLVICGHGHAYERHYYNGRTFLVIGGGGAPLDEVGMSSTQVVSSSQHHWLELMPYGDGVVAMVHDLNGGLIDDFSVSKPVPNEQMSFGKVKGLFR